MLFETQSQARPTTMDVVLEKLLFEGDNAYVIAAAWCEAEAMPVTVRGTIVDASAGMSLTVHGFWKNDPRFGEQFIVKRYEVVRATTAAAMQAWLAAGPVRGIGPVLAERIVDRFGSDTRTIMENEIGRLTEVDGIGAAKLATISESWREQEGAMEVQLMLAEAGVSTALAGKIYGRYGDDTAETIRTRPYELVAIPGIGFAMADKIAAGQGITGDDPARIRAAMDHALFTATRSGHVYLPWDALMRSTQGLLGVAPEVIPPQYAEAIACGDLVAEPMPGHHDAVYSAAMWVTEKAVAKATLEIVTSEYDRLSVFDGKSLDTLVRRWETDELPDGQKLALLQDQAVKTALSSKLSIMTGGPGCGKSFTIKAIVDMVKDQNLRVALTAPTGRAAQRMEELAGVSAKTIHRLLELQPGSTHEMHQAELAEIDMLIVDEVSMLDIHLAKQLLCSVAPGTHVLLVGDTDQLPSVGPGKVLADLIASGVIPVTTLTQVFRQGAESGIVASAHEINRGVMPQLAKGAWPDFHWWKCETDNLHGNLLEMLCKRIPAAFGFTRHQIQVLAPMRGGTDGIDALNQVIQEAVNPAKPGLAELKYGQIVFRVGDRVMHIKNNYDKNIFNGTPGVVESIVVTDDKPTLTIVTDDGTGVEYTPGDLYELVLAYAITIHKSQGSEYPVVIIPVTTSSWHMLKRNLIYTAITRGRKLVVLMGSTKALRHAVTTIDTSTRYTNLTAQLTQGD